MYLPINLSARFLSSSSGLRRHLHFSWTYEKLPTLHKLSENCDTQTIYRYKTFISLDRIKKHPSHH